MSDMGKMPSGGCHREVEFDWNMKGVSSKDCPVQLIDSRMNMLFRVFNDYEFRGVLPYEGGSLSQPCLLMGAIDVVGRVWNEHRRSLSDDNSS